MQEMGAKKRKKTQNGGPHLSFIVENWGIHMVKDKGCGWPK
jgi:hypothetical protein